MSKKRTSLQKLRDFIGMQGGELGDGWVRDKENFRYIPPKDFIPANGQPRASYYLTRTDIAVAMGLFSMPRSYPSPATWPNVDRRNDRGQEQSANTPDSHSAGLADGNVLPGNHNRITSKQTRNRNAVSAEEQLGRLREYIRSQGQNAGEDVALAPGWSVSCTRRSSGKSEGHIDFYYHPPRDFVAVCRHKLKYRSFREVANAHGLLQEDIGPHLLPKTVPAKRSCSSMYAVAPLPTWETFDSRSAGRRARTTPLTLPFLESAEDLGREGANRAVKEPEDQPASAGGEAVGGPGPSAEATKKVHDSQQDQSHHAAAFAGFQLTPVIVSSAVSDSDISVDILSVSTERSTPGGNSSSPGASRGDEDPLELFSKLAKDSKGFGDADKTRDRYAHLQDERDQSDWQKIEEEMQALKRRNRELEKAVQQCKLKLKEVEIAEQMLWLSGGCNTQRMGQNLQT
ncbi:g2577 [Coccomyxa elongata]